MVMSPGQAIKLDKNWSWKQRNTRLHSVLDELGLPTASGDDEIGTSTGDSFLDGWKPTQTYPSEIHVELLKSGRIPHPYVGFNEHKVQWIGEVEWLYKCSFRSEADTPSLHAVLEFEGLDTICDVYLNGIKILSADNMFRTYVCPVSLTSPGLLANTNTLLLHFKSAKLLAKAEEEKYGAVRAGSTNLGDPSRVYVRKAQYDWRWDWGPELMTVGPYRPITLRTYTMRIEEVHTHALVTPEISSKLLRASLTVDVTHSGMLGSTPSSMKGMVVLKDAKGEVLREESYVVGLALNVTDGAVAAPVRAVEWDLGGEGEGAGGVELWWPVGYGEQTMYEVEVSLLGPTGELVDRQTKHIGFRSVKLVQEQLVEPDQYGTGKTFLFEVNGVRMFMGGSNWIPADNFLTTITPDRYRAWLTLLRDGNQNMVRLWGGGVYEPDVFYDICDELGILVWQDFQFACGVYPAHDSFVQSVSREAEDNVKRLRHHPSMALFCGNNEDYQQVLQWGGIPTLPAVKIYEEVLPSIVSRLTVPSNPRPNSNPDTPLIPYHRGSPYGGKGWDTSDPTIGDVHQWNVWGGKELAYQDYDQLGGRFVSEFGMPSMPCLKTIATWMDGPVPPSSDGDGQKGGWYAQSKVMAQHTRAGSFERRFAIAMNENFRITADLETHVYNTQLMQSDAISYAYSVWRRKWGGMGKQYTSGVLVWQLNDCWPVTSWAIVDYYLRPKPAYFTIARQLATFSVGIFRTVIKNRANDRPRQHYEFGAIQSHGATLDIWGTNSSLSPRPAKLEIHCVDLNSSWTHKELHDVILLPNQATELLTSMRCPGPPKDASSVSPSGDPGWTTTYSVVVGARLLDIETGTVIARYADWPQPYRYLDGLDRDPGLEVKVEGEKVVVDVGRPVKGLSLSVDGGEAEGAVVGWSDNALDVMPGDQQVVWAKGLDGRKLKVAYLGKERASVA